MFLTFSTIFCFYPNTVKRCQQNALCVSVKGNGPPHIYYQNLLICIYINKTAFSAKYQKINLRSFSQKYVAGKKGAETFFCAHWRKLIFTDQKIYIYIWRLLYFIMNWFTSCWEVINTGKSWIKDVNLDTL